MPLTDKAIKNAKPQTKPYKLPDGEGMYILVQPTGSKLWRMKYRFAGKENVLSIGKYPLVSLSEARDIRHEARKALKANVDPNRQKKQAKLTAILDANNSFRAVTTDWHAVNLSKWTPEHAERLWRRLELHALPQLGSIPIVQIRTPELIVLLRKLEKQRKPETAVRLAQTLKVVFRYAQHSGIIEQNPASDLQGVITAHEKAHFAAIHPSELPELLSKLAQTSTREQNRIAVRLLMHTFLRPGELRYGKWAEIDWEEKVWSIPPERMKKRRPHIVPLSQPSLILLKALQSITGYSEYLFPSQQRRRHPVMSENTINKILKNMGYAGRQVGHGFRAIASTVLNESGLFRPDVIEAQLAHIEENGSRKPYNRAEYLEERTQMMQWWSDYLDVAAQVSVASKRQKAMRGILISQASARQFRVGT
ncbi:MAG: tyrosine-type recombinase/integrase [Chitinophagaceae bacterium]|nr:tyrosine-type recombinase/integrase [Chitinophagaceae bacterium]